MSEWGVILETAYDITLVSLYCHLSNNAKIPPINLISFVNHDRHLET